MFKKHVQKNSDPKTSYTLIWEVDSYTPVIEYNLWFRQYRARSGLGKPEWTKLTVPAEHTTGFVFSKSYTIRGLKEKTIYEALLVSRNRYGWSKPSPILRFATEGAGKLDKNKDTSDLNYILFITHKIQQISQLYLHNYLHSLPLA